MFLLKCIDAETYDGLLKKNMLYISKKIYKNSMKEEFYHFGYDEKDQDIGYYTYRFEVLKKYKSNKLIELIHDFRNY